jgi:hypothetical protein
MQQMKRLMEVHDNTVARLRTLLEAEESGAEGNDPFTQGKALKSLQYRQKKFWRDIKSHSFRFLKHWMIRKNEEGEAISIRLPKPPT